MAWNYTYEELLKKVRTQLPTNVFASSERFEVPKVKGGLQGNHTIINNFKIISDYLRRDGAHLIKFLAGELATQAKIESGRADFTGKFRSEEINKKIDDYVNIFVKCSECKKPDTKLVKEDRLMNMQCMACGSKRPVRNLK